MPKKAHFIGIGGVGMSATAKLLRESGVEVSGSDEEVYPPISDFLKQEGFVFKTPYAATNVPPDVDLVVIGKSAKLVPETNSEVAEVIHRGLKISSFPEVLARLAKGKKSIVVAGSYGKSTSAALLSHCLQTAGLDPSYFIGAVPKTPLSSAALGKGEYFVIEGDEYPSSNEDPRSKFLHFAPAHLLITPLAHDHFNAFPTPEDYLKPFETLVKLVSGVVVICTEGSLSKQLVAKLKNAVTYGLHNGEFQAANIQWGEKTTFDIIQSGKKLVSVETTQLGEHSIQNIIGVAALTFSCTLLSPAQFAAGVASFGGLIRRLDRKSNKTSIPIFEGFGSSYEKAKSAIAAMKQHFPTKRLVVVFEPYTINWRRKEALSQYEDVFMGAQRALIVEPPLHGKGMDITLEQMAQRSGATVCHSSIECLEKLNLEQNDAVLLLSSGNLSGLIESIPYLAEQKFPA